MKFIILSQEFHLLMFLTSITSLTDYVTPQTTTQIDYVTSSAYTKCPVDQILCGDGRRCYNSLRKCDGIPDCNDGFDETNCPTKTLPPSCPEQQKRCPDGSCINPTNDCSELSTIASALSSLDAQSPGTTEAALAQSSSVVTPSSILTDVELSTSFSSNAYSVASQYSKRTGVTSSVQIQPEREITPSYSQEIQPTQASQYQSLYTDIISTTRVISSISSTHTPEATEIQHSSLVTNVVFISPSVSISTQILPSAFVTSDISPSRTIQSSVAIMSSTYDTATVNSENLTSSFHWPSSTYSENTTISTPIRDETATPSSQTSSLMSETFKNNSPILQSTKSIKPTKTIDTVNWSSIAMHDTTPFSTTAPPVDTPFPPWIIAVIVCGVVLILFMMACLCVVFSQKRKRTHKLPYKDPDDIGYRRSTVKRPTYDCHYDNRLVYQQTTITRPIVDNYITARNLK